MQKKSLLLNPNIKTSKIEPLKGIQVFFLHFGYFNAPNYMA